MEQAQSLVTKGLCGAYTRDCIGSRVWYPLQKWGKEDNSRLGHLGFNSTVTYLMPLVTPEERTHSDVTLPLDPPLLPISRLVVGINDSTQNSWSETEKQRDKRGPKRRGQTGKG